MSEKVTKETTTQQETVRVTIDGRSIKAPVGMSILEAARQNGIDIPSLCYHPGLEAFGACRLCVVEIRKHGWDKEWKQLVTSCLFPVEEGLVVETNSSEVRDNRKVVLDLQLARVPNSEVIRQLAAEYGVHDTSYKKREDADNCIMCGVCVRVCEAIGANAIATLSRGPDKYVDVPDTDACIGCLACALSCPTDAIDYSENKLEREIWGKTFQLVADPVTGKGVAPQEMIDHFSKRSGLAPDYFTKSDTTRKRETAAAVARVMLDTPETKVEA